MSEIKKDNAEEKILNAAQKVFIKKGMDGSRMQEIADEAGINKALLHYYFRTKQKLFEAIFKKVFKHALPNISEFMLSSLPIEEKLSMFIEKYIELLLRNPFYPSFILREISRDPAYPASLIKSHGVDISVILGMFESEMDAGNIRRMDPRDLMINILGLSVFPFVVRPLTSFMFFDNDKRAYNEFLKNRKTSVKEFILNSVLINNTNRAL